MAAIALIEKPGTWWVVHWGGTNPRPITVLQVRPKTLIVLEQNAETPWPVQRSSTTGFYFPTWEGAHEQLVKWTKNRIWALERELAGARADLEEMSAMIGPAASLTDPMSWWKEQLGDSGSVDVEGQRP